MFKKKAGLLIIVLFILCSMNLTTGLCKGGKGEHKGWAEGKRVGQKSETPPGWEKGLKKGWEKSTPPGWNKWDKKTKKGWKKGLLKNRKKINTLAKKKRMSAKEREKAVNAFEFAVRKGVPSGTAKKVVEASINQGLKGDEILEVGITLSSGVDKEVNLETLGSQVIEKLQAGYRGKKLSDEIHTMIEARYKDKMKAQEEKVGKPVGKEKPKSKKKEEKIKEPVKEKKEKIEKKDIEKGKDSRGKRGKK